jgi:AAA-like domain
MFSASENMSQRYLEIVNQLLAPNRLNYIQEIVFLQSWEGKRYREIAVASGYDYDYIKEVGFQLWQALTDIMGRKVTKKNMRLLLIEQPPGGVRVAVGPTSPFLELAQSTTEFPSGPVSLYSSLYVVPTQAEAMAGAELLQPGSLIRIKAPQQTGKTSLVLRLQAQAQRLGLQCVTLDLNSADRALFNDLDKFLRWLCLSVSRQLQLEPNLDAHWDLESGSKLSAQAYFADLLGRVSQPVVLIFDEITPLFEFPELAQDVLPLLRIWHEAAAGQPLWQNLRLVLVSHGELAVQLKHHQSPFNVGLPIDLPDFTRDQVCDLAQRHGLADQLLLGALDALVDLIGGHPYLIRLAFYWLQQPDFSLDHLLQTAPTPEGIYRRHLQRHWHGLQQHPELWALFQQVITASEPVNLDMAAAYQLETMGLITRVGQQVMPRSDLYRQYFLARMEPSPFPSSASLRLDSPASIPLNPPTLREV